MDSLYSSSPNWLFTLQLVCKPPSARPKSWGPWPIYGLSSSSIWTFGPASILYELLGHQLVYMVSLVISSTLWTPCPPTHLYGFVGIKLIAMDFLASSLSIFIHGLQLIIKTPWSLAHLYELSGLQLVYMAFIASIYTSSHVTPVRSEFLT